jgi:adenosylcobinamide kinase/adenosylcobinamide-phosphate guanylyltransferase
MSGNVPRLTLVLGGARSGKSAFAESLAANSGLEKLYLATGRAFDEEMEERIALHQHGREGRGWMTVEEPLDLAGVLRKKTGLDRIVLVDCLTLWLTNLMMDNRDIDKEIRNFAAVIRGFSGPVIFVSNEVGLGIVPGNAMSRAFRDHAGRLHQKIAELADCVYFVAAGLPLKMKG